MNDSRLITPFPSDIDRDSFGHWLSGFVDGEGCFYLGYSLCKKTKLRRPRAQFIITLRADDLPILLQIQSFLQCGRCHVTHKKTRTRNNPVAIYYATTPRDLADKIVPHFEQYPLRAKKAGDFEIWKNAIALLLAVTIRTYSPYRVGQQLRGGQIKWSASERAKYVSLFESLRHHRAYDPKPITLESPPPDGHPDPTLFDGLNDEP